MKPIAWLWLLAIAGCVGGDPQTTGEVPRGSPPSPGDDGGATPTDAAGPIPEHDAGDPAAVLPWFERPDEAVATPLGGNAGTVAARGSRRVYGFLANDSKRAFVRWLDDRGAAQGAHVFASDAQLGLTGLVLDEDGNTYVSMTIRGALSGGPLSSPIEPHRKSDTGIAAQECVVMRLDADTHAFDWARFYTVAPAVTGHTFHSATCRVTDARSGSILVVGSYTSSRVVFEGGTPAGTPTDDGAGDHSDAGSPSSGSTQDGFVAVINALGASSVKLRSLRAPLAANAIMFDGRFTVAPKSVSVVGWTNTTKLRQTASDILDREANVGTGGVLLDLDLDDATKSKGESIELGAGSSRSVFAERIAANANGVFVAGRAKSDTAADLQAGDVLAGVQGGRDATFLLRRSGGPAGFRQLVAFEGGEPQVGRLDLASSDDGSVVALLPQLGAIDLGPACISPARANAKKGAAALVFTTGDLASCTRLHELAPFFIHGLDLELGRMSIAGAHSGAVAFGGPASFPAVGGTNVFRPFLVELSR